MNDSSTGAAQFWNTIATEFDSIYTGVDKNAAARMLDHVFRKDMYARFQWAMDCGGDVRGKSICDLGCGSGRFVNEFAKRGAEQVTGVDIAESMLALARELTESSGTSRQCDFVLSDVADWRTDQIFDLTVAIGFWDYIADPRQRLRRIRAITRGRFLSAWPRFWTWRMPVRKVRLQYLRGCPVYFFRRPRVLAMLEEAGFEIVASKTIGKLFCVEARAA